MIKRKNKKLRKILKALFGWITLCFFLNKGRSRLFFIKDFLEKKINFLENFPYIILSECIISSK